MDDVGVFGVEDVGGRGKILVFGRPGGAVFAGCVVVAVVVGVEVGDEEFGNLA